MESATILGPPDVGSLPRFPTRITLFTLPAIAAISHRISLHRRKSAAGLSPDYALGDHLGQTLYVAMPRARRSPVIHNSIPAVKCSGLFC